jgi:predicted AlkP superfamily pyrophosphatase or phosphodiesterase
VTKRLVLVVIDGLTPEVYEDAVERGTAPTLAALHSAGSYRRALSTFPSLTPVCMATLATGAHPDVHGIPHLVWYHRGEGRLVEYGSSFGAMRAAGARRSMRDAIVEMNARHLSREAVTVFESLEDAGLTAAAVNPPCYRGRTRHVPVVPGLVGPVDGPRRFFFYSLFESDVTGAPLAVRARAGGSIDAYGAAVGRWLVTRDGFDFLFLYLPDYDYASHALGPGGAEEALRRSDGAVGALVEAAGGLDGFLERYAVIVCSDHGQTHVERAVTLQTALRDRPGVRVTASNRAGMVYTDEPREVARLLAGVDGVDVALFREGGDAYAVRDGGEARIDSAGAGWEGRAARALANRNSGEVVVSAALGVEFADLGGRHHVGGGSHGSLLDGDSLVPMLAVGAGDPPEEIAGVAPRVLEHFGIDAPAYARAA